LFSAVSSAFVMDVHSNLQPDPNDQSAALLRAILLTLNQSAIPGETAAVLPVQGDPPSEIVAVTCLMYASLLISLLAAFVAMLGKQWLNRYLRNSGGSMIERCGDRQRKYDGLEKWPLHSFVESLPVMLQISLLLLACGLCRRMWAINTSVACTLIGFTSLGVVFYIAIVIAGMSSYACPFQTPASTTLRGPWKNFWCGINSFTAPPKRVPSRTYRTWNRRARRRFKRMFSRIRGMWNRGVQQLLRRRSPLIPLGNVQVQQLGPVPIPNYASQSGLLSISNGTSESESSLTAGDTPEPESPSVFNDDYQTGPRIKPKDRAIVRRTNADDVRCVLWVLRNLTDPEALDAAIRLAGIIRWFDDGLDIDLPYDLIVSTFEACFDPTKTLYPGSRDRAYYSGRAISWIYILARCKSKEFVNTLIVPSTTGYTIPVPDPDLEHILQDEGLFDIDPDITLSHSQWTSNILLHDSWAAQTEEDYKMILRWVSEARKTKTTIPLSVAPNRLLMWCTLLGLPVKEEELKVQDKSYDISCFASQVAHPLLVIT
jgi:hypothetical protein